MDTLDRTLFNRLIESGPRLAWIIDWLLKEVWSTERYQNLNPIEFLRSGEEKLNRFEMLVASAADRIYGELLSAPAASRNLLSALSDSDTAVIVFDGLSIREVPMILTLADKSGFLVSLIGTSQAAIPSETIDFINRELPCGHIAPSQLETRKELKEKGIVAIYSKNITHPISGEYDSSPLLVWSSFPDVTYKDSGAKFENHFENIHALFETTWINIVQSIKGKRKIVITSDHGYIFFGTGMDFPRSSSEMKTLNAYFRNNRNVSLGEKPDTPVSDDVFIVQSQNIAMVKGRVRTRSTGEAASRLYRHGGLSLMEMITPWIVLEVDQ
ncbi:MAG: hypothetical protein H8E17_14085 [Deltaproteobacteria bacterium]|nr:hypothetical protein [Deltaproteobacteria bacterium]